MSRLNEAELGNARPEDVAWLSSLSDTELDMLISLKKLVIQRAKVTDYENLADKFDVKMLRALGVILLEYIRERVKNSSAFSSGGSSRHSGKNWCLFEKEKNEMNINCSLLCATGLSETHGG
ncbi:Spc97 / Spc98 family of spindle pole body SBP component [Cinnamomum micranthum f. kanehirae]|uniref:Spc97 / Spc98 family of spindle pole body SBP component n=1 Tax=Cinnamomum micranthum f. kanehirae TaxID=337451 RepID=A0A3S3MJM3_9MAGN|nr:Spc97 / Spc98 family of spindle pole body SBP component [Cinnamomum micranthum f. kanehirae]